MRRSLARLLVVEALWVLVATTARLSLPGRESLVASALRVADDSVQDEIELVASIDGALQRAQNWILWTVRCLPRAVALQTLLRRHGIRVQLQLGVARSDGPVTAHAWVSYAGRVLGEPASVSAAFKSLRRARRADCTTGEVAE